MRICQRCVALSQSKAVRLAVRGAGLPGIVNTRRSCTCTVRSRLTTLVARRKSDGESASDINIMTWINLLLYENAFVIMIVAVNVKIGHRMSLFENVIGMEGVACNFRHGLGQLASTAH